MSDPIRLAGKAKTSPSTLHMDGTSPVTVHVQATTDELRAIHNQTVEIALPASPQADTPAPQGRWAVHREYGVSSDTGAHMWCYAPNQYASPDLASKVADMLNAAELVRRDGTDPTPEAVYDELRRSGAHLAAGTIPLNVIGHVLAAVRALRDGGTR